MSLTDVMIMAQVRDNGGSGGKAGQGEGWDAYEFFQNSGDWLMQVGGAFLSMMGVAAIVWGGFLLVRKLMSGQQNQDNWFKIVCLIIVGGALTYSGINMILKFADGGQKTIEDFGTNGGNGMIMWAMDNAPTLMPMLM